MSVSIPSFIKNFNEMKFMEILKSNEFNFNNIFKYFIFSYNAKKMPNHQKDVVSKIININFNKIWIKVDNLSKFYYFIDATEHVMDWKSVFIDNAINFIHEELFNEDTGFFEGEYIEFLESQSSYFNKDYAIEKMKNWILY